MGSRPFEIPADLDVLAEIIPPSFQYPENESWNVREDEMESMVETMQTMRKMWPLLRVLQVFVPPFRDIMRGFVWEEENKPVGLVNVIRMGNTRQWLIGNVAVLPEFRRRGIARKLVEESVAYARGRDASHIMLDVIDGNVPAYELYVKLGFEHFSGNSELSFESDTPPDAVPMPEGYRMESTSLFNWEPRYMMSQRITPPEVAKYRPVEQGRFRQPLPFRVLGPLFLFRAMGFRPTSFFMYHGDQLIAYGGYDARLRAGGINILSITLDPAHAAVAPFLVRDLTRLVMAEAPGRRVEVSVPHWQNAITVAAEAAGFERRADMHSLGIVVQ